MAPRIGPLVKTLLIVFATVFFLQAVVYSVSQVSLSDFLGFSVPAFLSGFIWQPFSYGFLHGSLMHLLFNCFALYMFGGELERRWGSKKFGFFLLGCSIGAALIQSLVWLVLTLVDVNVLALSIPVIGASGALYGMLMAAARLFGQAQVLVFFVLPMRLRTFVVILFFIELYSSIFSNVPGSNSTSNVAHLFHLGGLVTGFLILWYFGTDLNGRSGRGGSGWGRKKELHRDEVRSRLRVIVNDQAKDGKYPIQWN